MSNSLADDDKIIQERINKVMDSRKMKRWEKIIVASVFVVFMLADSLVAFAYPNVYHVDDETDAVAVVNYAEGEEGLWAYGQDNLEFEVLYDKEFIDENGTITPVNDINPAVLCIRHNWLQGYFQVHEKNDDGGCTVTIFNSKRCPYCNSVVIESWYATQSYAKCPH